MKTIKQYFRFPETYVGIIMAFVIQLVFFLIWLNAFNGAENRLDHLRIAMVSEDKQSQLVVENLIENLPFQMGKLSSIETAKKELDNRNWDMVVYFPSTFSEDLSKGNSTKIEYYINQASSSVSKQVMESVSAKITEEVNTQVFNNQKSIIGEQLGKSLSQSITNPDLVNLVVPKVITVIGSMNNNPVTSDIHKTNSSGSFASNLIPLMFIIISYVGAMVMNLLLNMSKDKVAANRWGIIAAKLSIDIMVSLLISLVTISMLYLFNIPTKVDFLTAWILQSTVFYTFLVFSGIFFNIFGKLGMVINLIILVTQLSTSGVLMPRVMLSDIFYSITNFLPATFAVDGYYSILFGGGNIIQSTSILFIFSLVSFTLILLHSAIFQKNKTSKVM